MMFWLFLYISVGVVYTVGEMIRLYWGVKIEKWSAVMTEAFMLFLAYPPFMIARLGILIGRAFMKFFG